MKTMSFVNTLVVFFTLLAPCRDVLAQEADSLRFDIGLQFGGQRKRGVFSQTSLRIETKNQVESKKLILNNASTYTYTEANGFVIADDWHLRTIGMIKLGSTSRLLPVFAHNYLENVLYRIRSSHRALGGVKVIPFEKKEDISITAGTGYEFSRYMGEIFVNSSFASAQRNFALAFLNLAAKSSIGKSAVRIEFNFSAIQSFRERNDFSFWSTLEVDVPLGKKFSTGVHYDHRYRHVHLEAIPKVNDLLLFSIKYDLRSEHL